MQSRRPKRRRCRGRRARRGRPGRRLFVVSDGTGDTAADTVRAAMLQFHSRWRMRKVPDVRSAAQARAVVQEAAQANALVVFTLVNRAAAQALRDHGTRYGVPTVDLLGPLIANIAEHLHLEPRLEPGLLHGFSDEYFRRIEAVEFAVRHDDGANLHTLHQADIVLVGPSRTSKTPLSMYLAQRGLKTGNVPLVPGIDPPRELFEIAHRKVYGLLADAERLVTIRRARVRGLGTTISIGYAEPEIVERELTAARRLFVQRGWRVIDITGRAVEETASRILELHHGGWAIGVD
ncbi:MAG: kinase/pyrophosphorylase [Myxococcota bacterium]|nr:kinase/pyrophosphorylase [Myxococcota bacterium]